jgi:hypothetical protein
MDLKSRGRKGKSYLDRAVKSVGSARPFRIIDHSNYSELEDAQLTKKVEALFAHEPLFERLHTEPIWKKTYRTSVKSLSRGSKYVKKQKFTTKAVATALLLAIVVGAYYTQKPTHKINKPDITKVAGATDTTPSTDKLVKEKPSFNILYPEGHKNEGVDTVKVSPAGNDPVYAFSDTVEGAQVTVSQQQVPKSFDYNQAVELERVAKDFQAINVIQIDANKVYHGLNEKTKVQSLIFIKNNLLVFIRSSNKLTDDQWTGYILSLK